MVASCVECGAQGPKGPTDKPSGIEQATIDWNAWATFRFLMEQIPTSGTIHVEMHNEPVGNWVGKI